MCSVIRDTKIHPEFRSGGTTATQGWRKLSTYLDVCLVEPGFSLLSAYCEFKKLSDGVKDLYLKRTG